MWRFLAVLAFLFCATAAHASCPPVPYTFTPGTTIASGQVNTNFSAVVACVNSAPSLLTPSVTAYGADPTGILDSAPAFAAACIANPGATIIVPVGVFLWNTSETFVSPCHFAGQGWNERTGTNPPPAEQGSWINIVNPSVTPITWEQPNGNGGTGGFDDIAFEQVHPNQLSPPSNWAPTVYPYVFTILQTAHFILDQVYFYGIYDAINVPGTSGSTGRLQLSHIYGQVFHSFLNDSGVLDTQHLDDIHLWPFWSNNIYVVDWSVTNADAFTLKRVDGIMADHWFIFGYNACINMSYESGLGPNNGPPTAISIGSLSCDASKYAVLETGNSGNISIGSLFWGGETQTTGAIPGSSAILDSAVGVTTVIGDLHSLISGGPVVSITNAASNELVKINSAVVNNWNQDADGSAAFSIASTSGGVSQISFGTYPSLITASGTYASVGTNGVITKFWLPWTPTFTGSGTPGTPAYVTQQGQYMIDGTTMYVVGAINFSGISGSPTGSGLLGGLPFATTTTIPVYGAVPTHSVGPLTTGYTTLSLIQPNASGTTIQVAENGNGVSEQLAPIALFTGGAAFSFTLTTRVLQ